MTGDALLGLTIRFIERGYFIFFSQETQVASFKVRTKYNKNTQVPK